MRLKAPEGPLALHNQHNEILQNSPKRINTLQNSRYISAGNTTSNLIDNNTRNYSKNNTNNPTNNQTINNVTDYNNYNAENFLNNTNNFYNTSECALTPITPNLILNATTDGGNDIGSEERYGYTVNNLTEIEGLNGESNETQELQWCNTADLTPPRQKHQPITNNKNTTANNRNLATARNINSCNLATQLRIRPQQSVSSAATEYCDAEPPSPDDVLIKDDLDPQASSQSSTSVSPGDEDIAFDVSESSDEGNDEIEACKKEHSQNLRCIVNPNYPGFQHLAHTLIDGYTEENLTTAVDVENNVNNNNPEENFQIDKFDSINRLDSIENIQKVFHDKSVLDLQPIELGDSPSSTAQELVESTTGSEQDLIDPVVSVDQNNLVESSNHLDQDLTTNELVKSKGDLKLIAVRDNCASGEELGVENLDSYKKLGDDGNTNVNSAKFNKNQKPVLVNDFIKQINGKINIGKCEDSVLESVVGDFSKEVENELDKVGLSAEQFENQLKELELVADKLKKITDSSPSAIKYYFEPNGNEPFEKVYQADYLKSVHDGLNSVAETSKILKELNTVNKKSSDENQATQPIENVLTINRFESRLNLNQDKIQLTETLSQSKTHQETHESLSIPKEIVRPTTLDLPARYIKTPLKSNLFLFDDESAEDLKAEQLIMSAKLIDISRTPAAESNNESTPEFKNTNDSVKVNEKKDNKVLRRNATIYPTDLTMTNKMVDAALSCAKENIPKVGAFKDTNSIEKNEKKREWVRYKDMKKRAEGVENKVKGHTAGVGIRQSDNVGKFIKEDLTKNIKEKETDSSALSKKAKFSNYIRRRIDYGQQLGSLITFPRRESIAKNRDPLNRRSVPMVNKRGSSSDSLGGFDVYNIETAMPKIDLEAIESHLRATRDEERRRRTDREEIRRRLAMGSEDDYYSDRPGRKPSLQSRLQSGMNLQICFMNETVSDPDSPTSDSESRVTNPKQPKFNQNLNRNDKSTTNNVNSRSCAPDRPLVQRPATLPLQPQQTQSNIQSTTDADFFTRQARLQTEARMALAQAKEMARMQMEIEKQRQKKSPITEMVRNSLEKVGIPFPEEKRRLSRQILTEMNVAQLQVIVNDLHTQIETLNENLVKFLMDRDDLHMEQDSMLVDIEDLTRYLSAKEQVLKDHTTLVSTPQNNNLPPPSPAPPSPLQTALNNTVRPHLHRIASLVKK